MKKELIFEPDFEKLEEIREAINSTIEELVGKREWSYELMLALEEAIVNVIDHGYKNVEPTPIRLLFNKTDEKLIMQLMDKGTPYDPTKKDEIDLDEHYKSYKNRGLGIFMITEITDGLSYRFDNLEGNVLIMEKKL